MDGLQIGFNPNPPKHLTHLHEECCILNGGQNSFGN
jgi:hypothetical protein